MTPNRAHPIYPSTDIQFQVGIALYRILTMTWYPNAAITRTEYNNTFQSYPDFKWTQGPQNVIPIYKHTNGTFQTTGKHRTHSEEMVYIPPVTLRKELAYALHQRSIKLNQRPIQPSTWQLKSWTTLHPDNSSHARPSWWLQEIIRTAGTLKVERYATIHNCNPAFQWQLLET